LSSSVQGDILFIIHSIIYHNICLINYFPAEAPSTCFNKANVCESIFASFTATYAKHIFSI
jgi:hypothetical protein